MSTRDDLLNAARRANEVLDEFEVRKRIELGYTRIDPVRIAENADVPVMFQPLNKLLGAYLNEGRPGIMVNINRGPGLVHMTCAHELGHFFLGHQPQTDLLVEYGDLANIVERQADQFAFSLLLPRWLVKEIMSRKEWTSLADPVVLYQLSLRLGTSYTSTIWTLQRMHVISPARANELAHVTPKTIKEHLTGGEVPDDKGDVWLVDQHDRNSILEPHKSDYFVFDLPSKAGAGYVWSLDDVVAKGYAVEPLQNDVRETPVEQHFGQNPEFGPVNTRRFVAIPAAGDDVKPGTSEAFSMYQRRPWENRPLAGTDNQCTFNTEFEFITNGLDPKERMRRVEEVKATA
ncbi:ImmA/IrrE family metallo-endopeptidase [Undibacterium curvum]|uniref:ImmA/IrrE family metallo-endopeptidase n=1 Tax=Undibacterium curvum TaxID=2762294 RepID=A0ABR7A6U0_9BURK|nr:ImmA/IrrE family metallo-endopeptidase [Undibacterium curvum]MBC3932624.1 ImmA/IrrE family metallo-endopeptidase [Undibacterium curvum]